MHRKGEISKIKGTTCNIPIEAASICNILPRPAVSNGLIILKVGISPSKKFCFIYFNESTLKMMKNAIHFILKALKNDLIRNIRLISKFMMSQLG